MSWFGRRSRLLRAFHGDERGTAMTEFTFFLPVWIVVFIGISNLGKVGIGATQVQVKAQKQLWQKAINASTGFEAKHMSPRVAAPFLLGDYQTVAGKAGNPQEEIDRLEGAATPAMMEIRGHYGESYVRTVLLSPFMEGQSPTFSAEEVLGVPTKRYPHTLLNDTLDEVSFSGDWTDILATAVGMSGLVPSMAAGIRYGSVFSEDSVTTPMLAGVASVKSQSHWDVMVAPRPITGIEAETVTFGVAFLAAKLDKNYKHYQQFGKTNWGGSDGTAETDSADEDAIDDQINEDIDSECDQITSQYDSQMDAYNSAMDDYNDCESNCGSPPTRPTKPSGYDKCKNR